MAGRRSWDSLSPAYRARLSRGGVSKRQYESGASLARARGHGATPEHPRDARKNPERYREYNRKRQPKRSPEDVAYDLNTAKDAAYLNIVAKLGDYIKFREENVRARVYGGQTRDGEDAPGMTLAEARWTARADTEELRSRASNQFKRNPWFYH